MTDSGGSLEEVTLPPATHLLAAPLGLAVDAVEPTQFEDQRGRLAEWSTRSPRRTQVDVLLRGMTAFTGAGKADLVVGQQTGQQAAGNDRYFTAHLMEGTLGAGPPDGRLAHRRRRQALSRTGHGPLKTTKEETRCPRP